MFNIKKFIYLILLVSAIMAGCLSRKNIITEENSLSKAYVKEIILKTVEICKTTPPPSAFQAIEKNKYENGNYIDTIKPVIFAGKTALPYLNSLLTSSQFNPYETRILQIIKARIEHPDLFTKLEPYYIPYRDPLGENAFALHHVKPGPLISYKELTSEMIHPDDRERFEFIYNSPELTKSRKILKKYENLAYSVSKDNPGAGLRLFEQRQKELEEFEIAIAKYYRFKKKLKPNFKYLLPWEEALIRPIPWQMKVEIVQIVIKIQDKSSIPILGEILRQSINSTELNGIQSRSDRESVDDITHMIMMYFIEIPDKSVLKEISNTLWSIKNERRYLWIKGIMSSAIDKSKDWQDLLKCTESDPDEKKHIMHIQAIITEL